VGGVLLSGLMNLRDKSDFINISSDAHKDPLMALGKQTQSLAGPVGSVPGLGRPAEPAKDDNILEENETKEGEKAE